MDTSDPSFDSPRHGKLSTIHDKSHPSEKEVDHSMNQDHDQIKPPSQVMTPLIYKEMQRATRERRLSRQRSIFQPLRSLFAGGTTDRQNS